MTNSFNPILFSINTQAHMQKAEFSFIRDGIFRIDFPRCAITLRDAGSMRFRWQEKNPRRTAFFAAAGITYERVVPLELIHSHGVYSVTVASDTFEMQGDGIITNNTVLVPSVTVADCMPIYLFDPHTHCFGVLHSGWKGTGIVLEAFKTAKKHYGAQAHNFSVVIGPHINACCYTIDKERAQFFAERFTPDCVVSLHNSQPDTEVFSLSLAAANVRLLEQAGVCSTNIAVCTDCTCCSPFLGSFRRETAHLPKSVPLEKRLSFTPMAAYIYS